MSRPPSLTHPILPSLYPPLFPSPSIPPSLCSKAAGGIKGELRVHLHGFICVRGGEREEREESAFTRGHLSMQQQHLWCEERGAGVRQKPFHDCCTSVAGGSSGGQRRWCSCSILLAPGFLSNNLTLTSLGCDSRDKDKVTRIAKRQPQNQQSGAQTQTARMQRKPPPPLPVPASAWSCRPHPAGRRITTAETQCA